MIKTIKKIWLKFWGWVKPYLTPKMIPIILFIWLLTNGIWYVIAFVPIEFIPKWLSIFGKAYIGFLWTPFGIEKPIIIVISVFIYRIIYKEKFIKKEVSTHESGRETNKC